ncbi:MAG TPA: sigma-70 family RNA polymerase sigma factor [Opitutaceae bacterium]|nr:sigma-70 family RNA polymerase sigma factor [Opitutaceae bacterium]
MNDDDAALLRRYAEEGSQAAFAEVVRRHVDLVYAAALRRSGGDAHRAADVSQQVFTALARHARKLSRHAVLGAWLHTATRNAALNVMISEQRRQARELQALALEPVLSGETATPEWERLRPVLDAAIDELPETDRAAVVLRFLERRPFAEIGARLRVSEDAARMRTERALDKLRAALARRGITSTAAALGAAVAAQPLVAAPAGLASSLASASLAGGGAGMAAAAFAFMTTKSIVTLGAVAVFGLGLYFGLMRELPAPVQLQSDPRDARTIAALRDDNLALRSETEKLRTQIDQLNAANTQLVAQRDAPPPAAPLPPSPTLGMSLGDQQRAVMSNLRQIAAARDQFALTHGHEAGSVHDLVGAKGYIKTVRTVSGEDYAGVSMAPGQPLTVTAPDGMSVTYDPTGATTTVLEPATPAFPNLSPEQQQRLQELAPRLDPVGKRAVQAYRAANNGASPANPEALLPFLESPQEIADFNEYVQLMKAAGN